MDLSIGSHPPGTFLAPTTNRKGNTKLSGDPTGVLTIEAPTTQPEVHSWNGIPKERKAARERFEEVMKTRTYFAFVETSPGKAEQVRTFDDVERFEKKLGVVNVTVQPALQGG